MTVTDSNSMNRAADICTETCNLDGAIEWYRRLIVVAEAHAAMDVMPAHLARRRLARLVMRRDMADRAVAEPVQELNVAEG